MKVLTENSQMRSTNNQQTFSQFFFRLFLRLMYKGLYSYITLKITTENLRASFKSKVVIFNIKMVFNYC